MARFYSVRVALRDGRRALLGVQADSRESAVVLGLDRFRSEHPDLPAIGAATVDAISEREAERLNALYSKSFPTENALSGENGGGGNRTRVTSPPESPCEQEDRPRPIGETA